MCYTGSGEGIVGRGVYRNYYKGHMDRIKGGEVERVGLGWGRGMGKKMGENTDNCN